MKVLIIYENPESVDFYLLEVSNKDWVWMQKCHGHFVNFEMPAANEKACSKLSDYLEKCAKMQPDEIASPIAARDLGVDYVLHTGFGM